MAISYLSAYTSGVATVEDWFDSKRLRPDYVPTGWVGYGVKARAVPGHPFGLDLSAGDKNALIAQLRHRPEAFGADEI